jgi:hypothetical protein
MIESLIALCAGFIGGIFSQKKDDKSNELVHVTEERKNWRKELKDLLPIFLNSQLNENIEIVRVPDLNFLETLKMKIEIQLNPNDKKDNLIVENLKKYIESISKKNNSEVVRLKKEITNQFANLLKHDWERIKKETKSKKTITPLRLGAIIFSLYYIIPFMAKFMPVFKGYRKFDEKFETELHKIIMVLAFTFIFTYLIEVIRKSAMFLMESSFCTNNSFTKLLNLNIRE